jgi:hypothetical protein
LARQGIESLATDPSEDPLAEGDLRLMLDFLAASTRGIAR